MNCKQAEELLPLYAGRDLEEKLATLVTEHLQTCAACARVANEYRESVQLTEQFAPPMFSEAVYAEIRQRVLRGVETEAGWSETIASLFRPRLTWAIAGVLLIVVSMFAIYFMVNRGNDEPQLADNPPAKAQPGAKEPSNSVPQGTERVVPSSVNAGGKKQQLAGVQPQRKRSRDTVADPMKTVGTKSPEAISTVNNVSPQPSSLSEPMVFPHRNSAALVKPLRMEIQTKDPKIKIIWFVN
jgi:hypothetical protein